MKARTKSSGSNTAANLPDGATPLSASALRASADANIARVSAMIFSIDAICEHLEDAASSPDAFPLVTAIEACTESMRIAIDAAIADLSNAEKHAEKAQVSHG